jgi:hypothetical protein
MRNRIKNRENFVIEKDKEDSTIWNRRDLRGFKSHIEIHRYLTRICFVETTLWHPTTTSIFFSPIVKVCYFIKLFHLLLFSILKTLVTTSDNIQSKLDEVYSIFLFWWRMNSPSHTIGWSWNFNTKFKSIFLLNWNYF